jgi:hypothetical protein
MCSVHLAQLASTALRNCVSAISVRCRELRRKSRFQFDPELGRNRVRRIETEPDIRNDESDAKTAVVLGPCCESNYQEEN